MQLLLLQLLQGNDHLAKYPQSAKHLHHFLVIQIVMERKGIYIEELTSSRDEVFSSWCKSFSFGRALAAHFLTYTDGSLAHLLTATRTRGDIACNRIPAIARSAHARTNGFVSDKSFWKQLIDNNASFGRLTTKK